jgi:hypothetical protein
MCASTVAKCLAATISAALGNKAINVDVRLNDLQRADKVPRYSAAKADDLDTPFGRQETLVPRLNRASR